VRVVVIGHDNRCAHHDRAVHRLGPLGAADANGFTFHGFTSRAVATSGRVAEGTTYRGRSSPTGATFTTDDGG
jgi:hypothetical protein